MKKTNEIISLVLGQLKGESKIKVLSLLDHDQEAKSEFRKMKNICAMASTKKELSDYQTEQLYLNFRKQLDKKSKTFRVNSFFKYAAVFIIAIGISSLYFYSQPKINLDTRFTTAIADNGQISKVILPDESVVWLNSGSKITYNNNFAINNREINLIGQAFFQVTKNRNLPLKVFCKDLEVKVVGTRFDVNAYPEDKNVRVVLEKGKVEMMNSQSGSFYTELKPGEMGLFDPSTGKVSLGKVNLHKFISWKDGILVFRDDPMTEVIPMLQRRYDINIEVKQPKIFNSVFTATIKDETLEEIFQSIGFACSVHYKIIRGNNLNSKTRVILTSNTY